MSIKLMVLWGFLISVSAVASSGLEIFEFRYKNNTSIKLSEQKFDKSKNKISYCGLATCLINGKPFWGTDGLMPTMVLNEITVTIGNKKIELDSSSMFNPLLKKLNKDSFKIEYYYNETWKVKGRFSDGAGAYFAEWIVTKDGSVRTLLGDSELIFDSYSEIFKQ